MIALCKWLESIHEIKDQSCFVMLTPEVREDLFNLVPLLNALKANEGLLEPVNTLWKKFTDSGKEKLRHELRLKQREFQEKLDAVVKELEELK